MSVVEGLQLAAAAYLIALAAASSIGAHRALLAYPFYAAYSLVRISVRLLSLGKLGMAPIADTTNVPRKWLKTTLQEWRERRQEEGLLAAGEDLDVNMNWQSQDKVTPVKREFGPDKLPIPQSWTRDEPDDQLPTLPDFK